MTSAYELTILIGHPPGGSYDLYAQLAAAHIGKYIPGKPTVIVQSMPGGAGSKAAAFLYARGPKDGSMISLFPETIAYVQLMDPAQGRWDVTKMSYIGSFAPLLEDAVQFGPFLLQPLSGAQRQL